MIASLKISEETLRAAVVELLIRKIGEEWNIEDLKKFDSSESNKTKQPGIYFLGLNEETDKLHWIFINNRYQATTVIKGLKIENEIEKKEIKQFLKKGLGDRYIIDPTNLLEVERNPVSFASHFDPDSVAQIAVNMMNAYPSPPVCNSNIFESYLTKEGLGWHEIVDNRISVKDYVTDENSIAEVFACQ